MSHGITQYDGMLSVQKMPWHGLGYILDEAPTRREAQEMTMDWEPVEEPVYRYNSEFEKYEQIEGSKTIVRNDNDHILGVVNSTLGVITNEELWDVAEAVQGTGNDIRIETAGSLDGGKKVWALLRFDEPIQIKGDPNGATVPFFALQNDLVGMGSFRGQALNTRIVCANTSKAADVESSASGYEFTFRHSSKVGERIEEAKQAVTLWREGVNVWQNAMDVLAQETITEDQRGQYVREFMPMPPEQLISERVRNNVITNRIELFDILNGETCEGINLTRFGLVQASLEWRQHIQCTKGKDARSKMESRFKRSMLTTDRFGHDVVELAMSV